MPTVPGPDERICFAQLSLGVMTQGSAKLSHKVFGYGSCGCGP